MNKKRKLDSTCAGALAKGACAALLAAGALGCGASDATDPNDAFVAGVVKAGVTSSLTVAVNGRDREYLLHDVQMHSATVTPLPLVILLHGSGLTSADIRAASSMDSLADVRNFLVAYPQGVGSPSDWNAGTCCGDAMEANVDDVAFIKAVIADVSARLSVDKKRVYVAGFSDGARMTYRVACEMSAQIAAVAAVSGSLVTEKCVPTRKMPVIAFHGTADPSVFYDEPSASPFLNSAPTGAAALPPAVHFWMSSALCKTISSFQFTPSTTRSSGNTCSADVILYSTKGGGHAWPSEQLDYDFAASPLIVDFFQAHKLP